MRVRPTLLPWLALFLAVLALAFPVQLFVLYDQMISSHNISFSLQAFIAYSLLTLALFNAYLVYQAYSIIRWTIPLLTLSIALYYVFLFDAGLIQKPEILATVFTVFLGINFFFLDEKSKFILDHPELRWWRIPERKPAIISCYVSPFKKEGFSCETFDLSIGGAFFPFAKANNQINSGVKPCHELAKKLKVGDQVSVRLTIGSLRSLRIKAKLVRTIDRAVGSYPPGFAVQFEELDRKSKKTLEAFINSYSSPEKQPSSQTIEPVVVASKKTKESPPAVDPPMAPTGS